MYTRTHRAAGDLASHPKLRAIAAVVIARRPRGPGCDTAVYVRLELGDGAPVERLERAVVGGNRLNGRLTARQNFAQNVELRFGHVVWLGNHNPRYTLCTRRCRQRATVA